MIQISKMPGFQEVWVLLVPVKKTQEHAVNIKILKLALEINLILPPLRTVLKYGFRRKISLTLML